MKAVIQRVKSASVTIDGKIYSKISHGLLVLIGITDGDNKKKAEWVANKLANLRIFEDEEGRMNLSVTDKSGSILIVPNFTLYGDAKKGFRPSFGHAAPANISEPLYDYMIDYMMNNFSLKIAAGRFGAMMEVGLINDGPVTIILEK
ncbi:MAG: D-aminoacyl-tRNA deacylase [Candidatus Kapaibacterium sp.]